MSNGIVINADGRTAEFDLDLTPAAISQITGTFAPKRVSLNGNFAVYLNEDVISGRRGSNGLAGFITASLGHETPIMGNVVFTGQGENENDVPLTSSQEHIIRALGNF